MSRLIFTPFFILLLGMRLDAAHVEPPTNVTLDCDNMVYVVKWNYAEFSPGLKFKIWIGNMYSGDKEFFMDSPNLQANFSLDTDPADPYSLEVTAMVGDNESAEAPHGGIQFSYSKNSIASKKCFLDLPAVNVTVTQNGVAWFSFMHPWLLYKNKMPVRSSTKKKRHSAHTDVIPDFDYEVYTVGKGTSQMFICNESECEDELSVEKEGKVCLKILGEMNKMAVRGTQEYCAMPATEPAKDDFTYIIYIMVCLVVCITLALILFMVYKKLTAPSSPLPDTMTFKDHLWRAVGAVREQVSVPEVEPASPTPLLSSTEISPPITFPAEPEVRAPIGVMTGDNGVCEDGEIGGDEGYTQGRNLEEDDEKIKESSGYESRPVFD